MFFVFRQNNSGGVITRNDKVDVYVYIEACCQYKAIELAKDIGLYFDGYRGEDCKCCGPRWDTSNLGDTDLHVLYKDKETNDPVVHFDTWGRDGCIIYYKDGRKLQFSKMTEQGQQEIDQYLSNKYNALEYLSLWINKNE